MALSLLTNHFQLGTSSTFQASNIEKSTLNVEKEQRGVIAAQAVSTKKEYTAEQKMACLIDMMMNGRECEACQ